MEKTQLTARNERDYEHGEKAERVTQGLCPGRLSAAKAARSEAAIEPTHRSTLCIAIANHWITADS
jgi:hypothetical protein